MSNIQNVRTKSVTITLDKERHLKYTLNSFAEMEEKYGSVETALKEVEANKLTAIRFMIWAGLIHEDENLTEKQVGNIIGMDDMQVLAEKLTQAMASDLPVKAGAINSPNA